jgi:hypothetical protein
LSHVAAGADRTAQPFSSQLKPDWQRRLWSDLPASWNPTAAAPGLLPRHSISRRGVVEVATAFGLPLSALRAFAVAALAGAVHLGRRPLEAGADLIGLDLGYRALVALGGLPAALAEPAGDYDPVTLAKCSAWPRQT